jgi:hypothetical protein
MANGKLLGAVLMEEIRERGYENGAHGVQAARLSDAAAIDVPRLLKALEKALSFHQPRQLHELAFNPNGTPRCGHDPDTDPDEHYEGDDDGEWYCESLPGGVACSGEPGSPDGEYADWPCDEYKAILAALTGKEADGG